MSAYPSRRLAAPRLALTAALLAGALLAGAHPAGAASPSPPPTAPPPAPVPSAEIEFATPTAFAVVVEPRTQRRRLYGVGDFLGEAPGAVRGAVVIAVEAGAVRLRDDRWPAPRRVAVGDAVPGGPGRQLAAIVVLDGVAYRYVPTPGPPDPEPQLRDLRNRRAWLEVEVPPPAPATVAAAHRPPPPAPAPEYTLQTQQRLDGPRLARVRVAPTGRDAYTIDPADVQWALTHAGQVLQEAWGAVRPLVSLQEGLRFRIQSPVADGVLGPGGFRVDSPKLAERAGLQAGDVVQSVNGQPVHGFADLFRLYQEVKRNPALAVVEVGLERQGQPLTKTYRIR